jgi:hypothetical protein
MGESNVEYSWLQSEVPEPISYWKFDEGSGSTAYDFTGDNDGAIYDASWTSGVSGEALNIHSTGYVDCGQDTSFDITGPITLSAWVKTTGTELAGLLGKWDASVMDGDTYQRAYSFLLNKGPGKVTFYLSNDGVTNSAYVQSSTTVNNGLWHMVTGVYDGNSIKIYIDGDCENIQAYSGGILSAPDENFYIGNVEEGVLSHPVNGLIDEVVIYDEALSESEIKSIYQAGLLGQGIDSVGPFFAAPYDDDYHLKSQRGRYWAEHRLWVLDDVTSPCVDAGDPAIVPSGEPMPNGGRINIGAYGGTAYASMSEWPLSGDLNRDGTVNLQDYAIMTEQWMDSLDWY